MSDSDLEVQQEIDSDEDKLVFPGYSDSEIAELETLVEKYKLRDFFGKQAYPNDIGSVNIPGERNIKKWIEALSEIKNLETQGVDKFKSFSQVTSSWTDPEVYDFQNWINFYSQGNHLKYKFAQFYVNDGSFGYIIPNKINDSETVKKKTEDKEQKEAPPPPVNKPSKEESMKAAIEEQRKKLISRLDSIEKILRTEEGQALSSHEFESFLDTIHELKKRIHKVNKKTLSSKLYQDLIICQGNVLTLDGFKSSAQKLFKVAQELEEENNKEAVNDFLKNLTVEDDLSVEDDLIDDHSLISEAQVAAPPPPMPTENKPVENKGMEDISVDDKKPLNEINDLSKKNVDSMLDTAFSNIKISDIVERLQEVVLIYKKRTLPRELSIIDLMLDSVGIAAYFPQMSEAINKSHDANNYIATRLDAVLSQLVGSSKDSSLDLNPQNKDSSDPQVEALKSKLESKDQIKQQKEYDKEEAESAPPAPKANVEIGQDLKQSQPETPPTPKPAPVVPPTPKI